MKSTKIVIDLFDFIKEGIFGDINIGMSKEEVLCIFPDPDDWMNGYDMQNSPFWRYGNFELHFIDHKLAFIFNDYVNEISAGKKLKLNKWLLKRKKLFLKDIVKELDRQKIAYDRVDREFGIDIIIRNSNVVLSFSVEDNKNEMTFIEKR